MTGMNYIEMTAMNCICEIVFYRKDFRPFTPLRVTMKNPA